MRLFFSMLVAAAASAARAGDDLSFAAPFDAVAATGDRQVSPAWRAHGSAAVHRNFARLTPDRQSKAGALWSAESVGADQATLELTFRISGQGQHFFGDGLALWLSADRAFRAGAFHGADPRFAGVAVVADTFRNDEAAAAHRDLALVASGGGAADAAALLEGAAGCDASVRYHENRGDFSVDRSSRVRLAVAAGAATLAVDAANDGTWVECAAVALPPALDGAWERRAHVGVTASTGQLADNHDVLALAVRTDGAPAAPAADAPAAAAAAAAAADAPVTAARLGAVEGRLDDLVRRLEHLQHHLEHEMVSVDDHVRVTLDKLARQEEQSEGRIDALEQRVVSNVEESLAKRVATLEQATRDAVQKRVASVETRYMSRLGDVVAEKVEGSGRGWTLPFVVLVLVDVVAFVLARGWYVRFKKSHLL